MLVLTRRPGQEIVIGGNIVLTVLEVVNNKVRIGIAAPSAIEVHRREVADRITHAEHRQDGGVECRATT